MNTPNGKPEFCEDMDVHGDPLDGKHADFDWEYVFTSLDGEPPPSPDDVERFAAALKRIIEWLVKGQINKSCDRLFGRRAMALAWLLDPGLFEGRSLASLAETLDISRACLSEFSSDFQEKFNFKARATAKGRRLTYGPSQN